MRELVDADSASLPTASTGGDALQESETVSRGNRACGSKVGAPPPRKTWDPKRGEDVCAKGTRESAKVSTMGESRRGESATPNTWEERRQEPR